MALQQSDPNTEVEGAQGAVTFNDVARLIVKLREQSHVKATAALTDEAKRRLAEALGLPIGGDAALQDRQMASASAAAATETPAANKDDKGRQEHQLETEAAQRARRHEIYRRVYGEDAGHAGAAAAAQFRASPAATQFLVSPAGFLRAVAPANADAANDWMAACCAAVARFLPPRVLSEVTVHESTSKEFLVAEAAFEWASARARGDAARIAKDDAAELKGVHDELTERWKPWVDDGTAASAATVARLVSVLSASSPNPAVLAKAIVPIVSERRGAELRTRLDRRTDILLEHASQQQHGAPAAARFMRHLLALDTLAVVVHELQAERKRALAPQETRRQLEAFRQTPAMDVHDAARKIDELWADAGYAGRPNSQTYLKAVRADVVQHLRSNLRSVLDTEARAKRSERESRGGTGASEPTAAEKLQARVDSDETLANFDFIATDANAAPAVLIDLLARAEQRVRASLAERSGGATATRDAAAVDALQDNDNDDESDDSTDEIAVAGGKDKRDANGAAARTGTPSRSNEIGKCWTCGKQGHRARSCPTANAEQKEAAAKGGRPREVGAPRRGQRRNKAAQQLALRGGKTPKHG